MPDIPNFSVQNNFPMAAVIQAAQENANRQLQARTQGQQSLVEGLQSIGQAAQSLFDQKVKVAQALANAHLFAQSHPELVGDNQVTSTPQGPVTQNQTASYDPSTGTVTPNRPPLDIKTIATAMYGLAPKDMLENQIQDRLAKTQQGDLALKQQYKPQELAIEAQRAKNESLLGMLARQIQGQQAQTEATRAANENTNTLLQRKDSLLKELSSIPFADKFSSKQKAIRDEISNIDAKLGTPTGKQKTSSGITYTVNP